MCINTKSQKRDLVEFYIKNWWFDKSPKGLKLNQDYMSEMSKCNTGISSYYISN